jgi:hypothetical protein
MYCTGRRVCRREHAHTPTAGIYNASELNVNITHLSSLTEEQKQTRLDDEIRRIARTVDESATGVLCGGRVCVTKLKNTSCIHSHVNWDPFIFSELKMAAGHAP